MPGIGIAAISTSPYRIERTQAQTHDGNDDFVLTLSRHSRAEILVEQPGREIAFHPGGAGLWMSDKRVVAVAPQAAKILNITLPRSFVESVAGDIDGLLAGGIPASAELGLLAGYAQSLATDMALSPGTAALAASHMRDLVGVALGAKRDAIEGGGANGVRAARLAAIRRDIRKTSPIRPCRSR